MGAPDAGAVKLTAPRLTRAVPAWWTGAATVSVLAVVTAVAAGLRFWSLSQVRLNPYYDAAVRSMSLSWHNLLYGAFEPGGAIAVDKTPVDLWLQVASVKAFGFSSIALHLPEALGSVAAVLLLYATVRRLLGRGAGLAAAAALAVLPVSVITGRSDTMDSLMMALILLAAFLVVRAARRGGVLALIGAGAVMGLAFNVKLFEALVPLPALVVLFWLGAGGSARARLARLGAGAASFVAVALAWLTAASLGPGHHPYAIGSTNGSVWNVAFAYNGIDRLHGSAGVGTVNPPSATRLFDGPYAALIGTELLGALVIGALAVGVAALAARRGAPAPRPARAAAAAIAVWLIGGAALFSAMMRLHPRYLEALTPAIAMAIGAGTAVLAGAARRHRLAAAALAVGGAGAALLELGLGPSEPADGTVVVAAGAAAALALACAVARRCPAAVLGALAVVAVLAVPTADSVTAVGARASTAGEPGAMPAAEVGALSRYLAAHAPHTRYEIASSSVALAGPLIVRDARPVLMLTTMNGRALTSAGALRAAVHRGEVRYALLSRATCPAGGCAPAVRWAIAHATDVGRQAGLGQAGLLFRLRGVR